jgi:ribonuclease BN (tRNA processing enzyme)
MLMRILRGGLCPIWWLDQITGVQKRVGALREMRLTVVGCGDAFGSGGRANTCFWIETGDVTAVLDFGATSLVALKALRLDPCSIDLVILSHLHGDHFGGLPFLLLDRHFDQACDRPLTIVGPLGTADRLSAALEVFFPGSSRNQWRFPLHTVDLPCLSPYRFAHLAIERREVIHPSGAPATGVRIGDKHRLLDGDLGRCGRRGGPLHPGMLQNERGAEEPSGFRDHRGKTAPVLQTPASC